MSQVRIQSASRLVIFSPNWLGDAVMSLPALADIRQGFPASTLAVAARSSLAPLFAAVPGVDEIVALGGLLRSGTLHREVRALAGGRFDVAIMFPNSFRAAWLARRAHIPERWGYRGDWRTPLLTRTVARPSAPCHQSAYYRQLARGLGLGDGRTQVHLALREETRTRAGALLEQHGYRGGALIGLAPGAAYGYAKRWPPERVAELIGRLSKELGATAVLVGSAADGATSRDVARELARRNGGSDAAGAQVVDLIGQTDLPLLMGVMSRCEVFVANDSGAMHLASALGLPVVAIFGPTDHAATGPLPRSSFMAAPDGRGPGRTAGTAADVDHQVVLHRVWCRPCMLRECPIDHRCMRGITAEMIFDAVKRRLPPGREALRLAPRAEEQIARV